MRYILLAILFLAFSVPSWAMSVGGRPGTTYYVSSSVGDDGYDGLTEATPWQTTNQVRLAGLAGTFKPYDRILFKRGDSWTTVAGSSIFRLTNVKGQMDRRITFGAYGVGDRPKFDAQGVASQEGVARLENISYVTIENMHFIGGVNSKRLMYLCADQNCSGAAPIDITNITFQLLHVDNSLEDQAPDAIHGLEINPFVTKTCPTSTTYANVSNIEIAHSTFTEIGGPDLDPADAINVKFADNLWVHHNTFIGTTAQSVDYSGGDDSRIEYNTVIGSIGSESTTGIKVHSQNEEINRLTLRGNLVIGTKSYGIGLHNIADSLIYNNTIFSSTDNSLGLGDWSPAGCMFGDPPSGNTVANNIFYGPVNLYGTSTTRYVAATDNTWLNNYFFVVGQVGGTTIVKFDDLEGADVLIDADGFAAGWVSGSYGGDSFDVTDDVNVDPELDSPSWTDFTTYGDFHIDDSDDPVVDDGYTISNYTYDLDHNPVPYNSLYDVGCYEYHP